MDKCLYYLAECQDYLNSMVHISLSDMFFNEAAEEDIEHNEKQKTGALQSLKNAIKALIKLVTDIIDRIKDFFATRGLSKDERERYEEFKKYIKSNPEQFKDVKVSVTSFKEYEKLCDETIKELDRELAKSDPRREVAEKIIEDFNKKFEILKGLGSTTAKRALMTYSLSTLTEIADRSTESAKLINYALKSELISLNKIEEELGNNVTSKFEKKIESLSTKGAIHRFKVAVLQKKEMTLKGVFRDQMNKILSFANVKNGKRVAGTNIIDNTSLARGAFKNRKEISTILGKDGRKVTLDAAKAYATAKVEEPIDRLARSYRNHKSKASRDRFSSFLGL